MPADFGIRLYPAPTAVTDASLEKEMEITRSIGTTKVRHIRIKNRWIKILYR